ncbi:MAG: glycosyltransferase [Acidimicrobiales bacterium]
MGERVRVAYTLMRCWHHVPGGTASSVLALAEAMAASPTSSSWAHRALLGGVPAAPWTPPIPWKAGALPADLRRLAPQLGCFRRRGRCAARRRARTTVTVPPTAATPLVVTVHDLFPLSAPEQFTSRGVRIMTDGIERARRHADVVCCPSQDTLDDCVAAGFDAARLRLVPWGATAPEVTADDRRRVRDRYRLTRPYVLWVGTIEPRKNLPTLLDAFARIQPTEADLVLVGPVGWHEQLEGHIDGVGSKVRQLGFVPSDDLAALYAEAEVFCFPSLREGFGLPALEAMAQSTPVLAGAGTAVAEVVGPGGVAIEPTAVDDWADELRALLADGSRREALGDAALERSKEFSWSRCASQMAGIYRELAS